MRPTEFGDERGSGCGPTLMSRTRMDRTPRIGSMAVARASTMLRSGGTRPMTRRTRTACRLVARLGDWSGTMVSETETATTRASNKFQGLLTKVWYLGSNTMREYTSGRH